MGTPVYGVIFVTTTCDSSRFTIASIRPKLTPESGHWAEVLEVRGPMQAAAVILTLIALYAAFYSFCRVAADADAQASRYRARVLQMRSTLRPVWRVSGTAAITSIEVGRGR